MEDYAYVVNVDGVVARGDEYLLIERGADEDHAPGVLGLPGGKLEAPPGTDDALEATVRREIHEEVGVDVGAVEYVCSSTFETDTGDQCLNIVTLCEYESGEATPRATDEVAAVHWLTEDELRAREDVPAFTERYVERADAVRERN
ncbi:NUDIX domain-containing protein [Halosimplex salinum]|uniref:NUDIX domain-containing protein n=1 Tax=Halosimplex salinum TaxID=1710538 RepID=UPI000F463C4C|nr:NUDIX domain-containing protein [Halosimplex salinum]